MNNKVIEEYIEKIHEGRESAWESSLRAKSGSYAEGYWEGVCTSGILVEGALTKLLKADEEITRKGTEGIFKKSIGDVLVETAKEVRK